jgi:uncharacterized protein
VVRDLALLAHEHFVFRLTAPRPTFALDMTGEEREIMAHQAEHWRPRVDSGQMVISGPALDASGSWSLGVVEADDEQEVRAFAADGPAVTTGTATIDVRDARWLCPATAGPLAHRVSWASAADPP